MKLILFVIGALTLEAASAQVLPDYIPQCKRRDPEYVKCILSAVEKVKPYLLKGIPQIKVPPYEPLEVPSLTVDRNLEAIQIKAKLNKMMVHGSSGFKIKNLKVDLNKYSAELSVTIPSIFVTGDYDVAGRLLLIPLGGKGFMEGNFSDISTFAKGSAKIIKKKGIEFLQIDKLSSKIRIGGGKVNFVDKNPSTSLIADTAATFFNGNPRLVLDIISPIVDDTAAVVVSAYINKIFGTIPLSELIPEN